MYLKSIELSGFKSFGKKARLEFTSPIASIVGPNGSGKSNVAEAFRFVLGEQSMKSLRSKRGEDLIWGGSPALPRANRASVGVVFNNTVHSGKRLLDLDFDEVVVERVVYRDGLNEYLLNGTQVRLKDVIRLLAGANIGGSGYQIISQGEADRILNASPRERREMLEDALGLKLYQHKKAESERKLAETAANIEKTQSLRREIAPHLRFLRTQVEKIERARELREELASRLSDYLAREHAWITQEDARLHDEERAYQAEVAKHTHLIVAAKAAKDSSHELAIEKLRTSLSEYEQKRLHARSESEKLARELGRAEGALEVNTVTVEAIVSVPHVRTFVHELEEVFAEAEREHDIARIKTVLASVRTRIAAFLEGLSGSAPITNHEARQEVERITGLLARAQEAERGALEEMERIRGEIARAREAGLAAERDLITLESLLREAQGKLRVARDARTGIADLRRRFEEEVREGVALVGVAIRAWDRVEIPHGALSEPRGEQEKRRRDIERLKIKIEESGIGNGDAIVREFSQTKERDEFLARELTDLETSAISLKHIIVELEKTIDLRFHEGLGKINEALNVFFQQLFGGGHAKLDIEKPAAPREKTDDDTDALEDREEETIYAGLSVSVSLPRKRVAGLEVLSGGERALTSIALIFAMSRVNPPPFLILDETDAALDEANSRRYADMIRELGKHSQLIVITHNRATMAAAGELYGVTMSADGVSKLLSVKLEEAERVAK